MDKKKEIERIIDDLELVKDNLVDDYLGDYEKGKLRVIDYVLYRLKEIL